MYRIKVCLVEIYGIVDVYYKYANILFHQIFPNTYVLKKVSRKWTKKTNTSSIIDMNYEKKLENNKKNLSVCILAVGSVGYKKISRTPN